MQFFVLLNRKGFAPPPPPPSRNEEFRWSGEEVIESRAPRRQTRKWEDSELERLMALGKFAEAETEAEEMLNWAVRHGDKLRKSVYADYLDEIRSRKHGPWV